MEKGEEKKTTHNQPIWESGIKRVHTFQIFDHCSTVTVYIIGDQMLDHSTFDNRKT